MSSNIILIIAIIGILIVVAVVIGIVAICIYVDKESKKRQLKQKQKQLESQKWFNSLSPEEQRQYIIQKKVLTDAINESKISNPNSTNTIHYYH